ncbi:phenylacetic acid degradation protein PaaD [Gammaproteobacteria bacterium 50_400_T64]|nr:phenylacetic acid degradation protein PaaD [Gammaproteobacteria bacterium 50_400_T64]
MTEQTIAEQCVAKIIGNDNVVNGLGIRLVEAEQGRAVLTMTVREDMLNSLGQCHGGMSFTLADAAFACASVSHNQAGVGAHAAMDYIRPGMLGDELTATATVRHQGRSASLVEVVVENQKGKQIAFLHGRSHNFDQPFIESEVG